DEISNIRNTYSKSISVYENLLDLKDKSKDTNKLDIQFAESIKLLSQRNYSSAEAKLNSIDKQIKDEHAKIAAAFKIPENIPVKNSPPSTGSNTSTGTGTQKVETPVGTFMANIITGDLNNVKVVVDTASDSDCPRDCPILSVAEFAIRSNAIAAMNGPYSCPGEYPSCADKKYSFDTLMMNKNKVYFNSDNNIYSIVPAVIFSGNSARFVTKSLEWGRDTSVDAVIAAQPLLVLNGEIVYANDTESKRLIKSTRNFIGVTNNTVYFGVVHNVTTAEMAHTIKALGIQNALNLDGGGSINFWSNGRYLIGPARRLPFAILMVKR
ncbi:MAG TPA: phosphodiester glycosidase family protein, partial [Candidatus Nitrosocosmicus sp.]|nr:phosphodiester glycosidase family protein [Candidatus Nitrosocosmicus sp.]